MDIQSLSVVVPNKKCINKCKFCVACMVEEDYENFITGRNLYFDLYMKDYLERLQYARDNGCDTLVLTGNSEPQQNYEFLKIFGLMHKMIPNPFKNVAMQTTGVLIDADYLYFLRHHVGISTISLSISSFNNYVNADYNGTRQDLIVDIKNMCEMIKLYRFNLRLSINLTDYFNDWEIKDIFNHCKRLGVDQITFRVLYQSNDNTEQDVWISEHKASDDTISAIESYIKENGRMLERLKFGAMKYSLNEMTTVLDNDCMSVEERDAMKYLILRENCKLYSKWDDKGSLLF